MTQDNILVSPNVACLKPGNVFKSVRTSNFDLRTFSGLRPAQPGDTASSRLGQYSHVTVHRHSLNAHQRFGLRESSTAFIRVGRPSLIFTQDDPSSPLSRFAPLALLFCASGRFHPPSPRRQRPPAPFPHIQRIPWFNAFPDSVPLCPANANFFPCTSFPT